MLDKTQYSSWASRMLLYIKAKENRKLLVDLVLNGPFKYGTITVHGTTATPATIKDKTYDELTNAEKLSESCDIKSTNIVLQGLPQDIYNMERESKPYDKFDMFTSVPGETIHLYYLRFAQLINNMHTIRMAMRPIQVNTKFINHLQPEWRKFVMDVKLAKDLNNTNFDHLYAHLRQHEAYADEVCLMKERFPNPLALVTNTYNSFPSYSNQTQYHQQLSPLASQQQVSPLASQQLYDVPMATIQDGRIQVQTILGRQNQGYACIGARSNATAIGGKRTRGTNTSGQAKVIRYYNCQEEGHMARQYTKPKRPRNSTWFKEKALLAKALESGMVLDEEHMAFLADNRDTETLELAKESRLKMHAKQNDPIAKEKKVNIAPIDHVALNKLSKHFIKEKELLLENDHLLELLISQDLVHTAMNSLAEILDYQSMENSFLDEYSECVKLKAELSKKNEMVEMAVCDEISKRCLELKTVDAPEFPACFEINELKAQLKAKDSSISKLKDHNATLKGKCVSEGDKFENISKVIALGMYNIDLEPLSPELLRNKEAHVVYLKHTQENTNTLREIFEQARELRPLDRDLDSALIGERVRVMSMGSLPCVGGGGGTLGGGEIAMEDEEVALVDGVFEGAFGVLGDEWWCVGDGVEALVDAMELEKSPHRYRHLLDEMMIQSDEWMKMRQSDGPLGYHDHFEVYEFVLDLEDA
ncbi:hypothetical protein Tco_0040167 [Tanacetum coccineum]